MVVQTLNKNTAIAQEAIHHLVRNMKPERICECDHALANAILTQHKSISKEVRKKLNLLVKKYI